MFPPERAGRGGGPRRGLLRLEARGTVVSESGMSTLVSLRNLYKNRAQGRDLVYRLEVPALDAAPAERLLLKGPSGCGKSTILDIIAMILRPDGAESFLFMGEDVLGAVRKNDDARIAPLRRHIGYILQTGGLLPFLSIKENILLSRRRAGLPLEGYAETKAEALGIGHLLGKSLAALSVGERQRAAIVAALAGEPALVLADEPTAALDPRNADIVLDLLIATVEEAGATLILVTHAPDRVPTGFRHYAVRPAGTEGPINRAVVAEEGA